MKLSFKQWLKTFGESFKKFFDENPFQHSAAIAYYTIFSLPGIAIITLMVAGQFYAYDEVKSELLNQIRLLMGQNSAEQINTLITKASESSDTGIMKWVGSITLIISATTVFVSLQNSLNEIWKIKPKPKKEVIKFLINRLLSLAMVASIGFLVLVSLMADTLIAIIRKMIENQFTEISYYPVLIANIALSLVVITGVFAAIYKILPDAKIKWNDVWVGAIITTLFFVTGKFLIGYYLSSSNPGNAYGAAGSLVALMAWVYYSVLILIFGAQFTYVYNRNKGRTIMPDKGAVAIKIQEVEEPGEAVTNV